MDVKVNRGKAMKALICEETTCSVGEFDTEFKVIAVSDNVELLEKKKTELIAETPKNIKRYYQIINVPVLYD